ncbi:MAG: YncE family protein [Chitinophagaceae bacterium]|nr:YncE family protein [Chitinophagaceae bacterium]
MKSIIIGALAVIVSISCATEVFAQTGTYHISKIFHIGGTGGWDYLAVYGHKLYVSHGNQVNIVDKDSGDSLDCIQHTDGVHGIAFIPELNKGYISNGQLNTVTVFELSTDKVLSQIKTGENPDFIFYEKFTRHIITCNGKSHDLSIIDPVNEKVLSTLPVGGKPETAVSDETGHLFVNIEDRNEIANVNLQTNRIENRWSLLPGKSPTGLAFDKSSRRLFAGCDALLIVLDADKGTVVGKLPIGEGCDGVVFDSKNKTILASNGEGTMSVIQEKSAMQYETFKNIPTKKSARTIALDEQTQRVYLPAADLDIHSEPGKRPAPVAGSFQVIVMTRGK